MAKFDRAREVLHIGLVTCSLVGLEGAFALYRRSSWTDPERRRGKHSAVDIPVG